MDRLIYYIYWVINIFTMILFLVCCGSHKSQRTKTPLELVQEQRDFIVTQIVNMDEADIWKHRCDKLTFKALLSAYGPRQDLSGFIYDDQIHRDIYPCYPEESRSEVSLDPILMMLHHILSYDDKELFQQVYDIGMARGWIMAEGPIEYTNIFTLLPRIYEMKEKYGLVDNTYQDILASYKGHIAALYIHLKGRINGSISEIEYQTLKLIYESNPRNPLYAALYHKYTDGDQSETLQILIDDFPFNKFPEDTARYGWGSCPSSVLYIIIVGILEEDTH